MFRRPKKKPRRPSIADECEAFLAGRSWQLYEDASYSVPAWAQLNRLALGSFEELVELANNIPTSAVTMTWEFARNLLAQQLIADTGNPERLREFQASTLVPLEPLLFNEGVPLDLSPDEFFHFVLEHIVEAARHDREGG